VIRGRNEVLIGQIHSEMTDIVLIGTLNLTQPQSMANVVMKSVGGLNAVDWAWPITGRGHYHSVCMAVVSLSWSLYLAKQDSIISTSQISLFWANS